MNDKEIINNIFIGKVVGNKFYFSERDFNGLFCFDLSLNQCDFIDYFEGESVSARLLHRICTVYKDKLFFLPERGRFIHIYNIRTGLQSCIDIEKETDDYVYDYVTDNNFLYYFQMNPVSVIRVDMESNTIKRDYTFSEWYHTVFGNIKPEISARLVYLDGKVYIPTWNANLIIEWDIRKQEGRVHETDIHNLFDINKGKNGFWLTDMNTYNIYLWNSNNETVIHNCEKLIEDENMQDCMNEIKYNHIIELGKYTIFVLRRYGYIFIRDAENCDFSAVKIPSNTDLKQDEPYAMFGYDIDEKYLYIFSIKGLITIEKKTLEVKLVPIVFNNPGQVVALKTDILKEFIIQNNGEVFLNENEISLDSYCRAICNIDLRKGR